MNTNELITIITEAVLKQLHNNHKTYLRHPRKTVVKDTSNIIPTGISNRHVHLSQNDMSILFGTDNHLTKLKDLSQPGQFAYQQQVTLIGPNGVIEKVRVLGPNRIKTQVEISVSDSIKLGIKAPIRDSGDLKGSAGITLVGPAGSITLKEGTIIAARHIHMHTDDAKQFRVNNGDYVSVKVPGPRGLVFHKVLVRVSDNYKLEMHVDIDEANAACLKNNDHVELFCINNYSSLAL